MMEDMEDPSQTTVTMMSGAGGWGRFRVMCGV